MYFTQDIIVLHGKYVEQDISVLHPLLIENTLSGGFSIYHESFRRFVLASLKDKKVDLERNVYGILADWLQKKPFFEFDKSFYYLTELLYKIKRDVDNIELIEKEFVLKSVSEGYSRKRIRMNLNCIIRSAGRIRNLVALATAGELLAMLDDMNEFDSNLTVGYLNFDEDGGASDGIEDSLDYEVDDVLDALKDLISDLKEEFNNELELAHSLERCLENKN